MSRRKVIPPFALCSHFVLQSSSKKWRLQHRMHWSESIQRMPLKKRRQEIENWHVSKIYVPICNWHLILSAQEQTITISSNNIIPDLKSIKSWVRLAWPNNHFLSTITNPESINQLNKWDSKWESILYQIPTRDYSITFLFYKRKIALWNFKNNAKS